nr:hypothetical protein [Tanacetum cinerariifolium]
MVKKELIVALKGELYFVKFIINPEEDDSEPRIILGRSFLRLAHEVVNFAGSHLTQEEAEKEALAVRISQKFALLKEERPVIETMAYNDKYKKILNEIWRDKVELDRKTVKEEEDVVKRIKGEALKEKDDPGRHDGEAERRNPNAQDNMKQWKSFCFYKFTMSSCYEKDVDERLSLGCDGEIDDMLRIRVREAG